MRQTNCSRAHTTRRSCSTTRTFPPPSRLAGSTERAWRTSSGPTSTTTSLLLRIRMRRSICTSGISRWDIRSGEERPLVSRKAHNGEVYSLDFNSKSEFLLLSGGEDGDVNLWDVRTMAKKVQYVSNTAAFLRCAQRFGKLG